MSFNLSALCNPGNINLLLSGSFVLSGGHFQLKQAMFTPTPNTPVLSDLKAVTVVWKDNNQSDDFSVQLRFYLLYKV